MKEGNVCPCPNINCPNHGDCNKCTSRHLRIRSLNYCSFFSIISELEEAVCASPNSASAEIIRKRIDRQKKVYLKHMKLNGFSEDNQNNKRIAKSKQSEH